MSLHGCPGLPDVAPEFVIRFEITAADKIIAWRFRLDTFAPFRLSRLNSMRYGFASAEENRSGRKAPSERKFAEAPHLAECLNHGRGRAQRRFNSIAFRERVF